MVRKCDVCNKKIVYECYVVDDGSTYFCSDFCLHQVISEDDYLEMYYEGLAYFTQFEEEDID